MNVIVICLFLVRKTKSIILSNKIKNKSRKVLSEREFKTRCSNFFSSFNSVFHSCFQMATSSVYSSATLEKVNKAKMSIESYYDNLVHQYEEREER